MIGILVVLGGGLVVSAYGFGFRYSALARFGVGGWGGRSIF